jgi:hypothetical protein
MEDAAMTLMMMRCMRILKVICAKRLRETTTTAHLPASHHQFFSVLLGVKLPTGYGGKISRYLDETKKRFSEMKSHDYHVLMT